MTKYIGNVSGRWPGDRGLGASRTSTERPSAVAVLLLTALGIVGCLPSPGPVASHSPSSSTVSGVPELPTVSATPSTGSPPAAASLAAVDACGLMTPAEVSGIVGGPLPNAKAVPGGGWVAGQCAWSSPTAAFLVSVGTAASIASVRDPAVSGVTTKLAEFEQRMASGDPKPVPGIGEAAIIAEAGMAAYKGDFYVEVINLRLTKDQMIEIVKLALGGS
jgi:hypothetical protein